MATCTNCGCNNLNCGCKDSFLTTPPPCPTPADCPDPQPCSEVFDAQCILYTGVDIECNQTVVVAQDATVAAALSSIVSYFCTTNLGLVIPNDIFCQESPQVNTLVVPENTLVNEAIELVVDYFCERLSNVPEAIVEAGTGITVTDNTVGNVTTYTVTNTGPQKYEGTYNSSVGLTVITHNLNTQFVLMSVINSASPFNAFSFGLGQDYTYEVTNANQITINDLTGMGAINVTVIG